MPDLPRFQPALSFLLLLPEPRSRRFSPISRTALQILRQRHLVREVVTNHPITPGDLQPIDVQSQPRQKSFSTFEVGRRRIENLPAITGEIRSEERRVGKECRYRGAPDH